MTSSSVLTCDHHPSIVRGDTAAIMEEGERSLSPAEPQPNACLFTSGPKCFGTSRLLSDEYFKQFESKCSQDRREFACGWGAAFINICITFPINKVMFRQMAYGVNATSAMKQLKGESLLYIYRGLLPPLVSKTIAGKTFNLMLVPFTIH
jgi:hypothetical protein